MINIIEELKGKGKRITSPFGWRSGGKSGNTSYKEGMHRGVDMGGYGCGEAFAFPFPVIVTAVRTSGMGTWGNTLCVSPEVDPDHTILVAHFQSISAKVGQRYDAWQELAKVGGTTHTGVRYDCHPHIEVQTHDNNWTKSTPWRGTPIDPEYYWLDVEPEKPSTRFAAGNIIRSIVKGNVNIRQLPGTHRAWIGQISAGEEVQIRDHKDNGIKLGGYAWWKIDQGWIAEDFFELVLFPDPDPVMPPELKKPEEPGNELPTELIDLLRSLFEMLTTLFRKEG